MGLLTHQYLDERMLKGLSTYKYKASGYTWLDDLHNPMWNWIVEHLFPMWLAPNLVTLTGVLFIIGSHVLLAWHAPFMNGSEAPPWVHIFAGLSIIAYVNLDCMDGKQARRTGSSSPLGQLFDHGCDALAVGLILINVATSVGLTCGPHLTIMSFAAMVTWVLAQWEEYHTGMMLYGNGYFGVIEANYALASVPIISGFAGVGLWQRPLHELLPFAPPAALADVNLMWGVFYIAVTCMSIQIIGQCVRVFAAAGTLDAAEAGHKDLGTLNAVKHLLLLVVFFALAYMFLQQPAHGGSYHCRALLLCVNLSYSVVATQLIMAHMAKEAFTPSWVPFAGLVFGVVNAEVDFVHGESLAYGMAAGVAALYLHYVVNVVNQVCAYLGIRCLVLNGKKAE